MKIAILQLSDIHIDSDTNFIFQHKEVEKSEYAVTSLKLNEMPIIN